MNNEQTRNLEPCHMSMSDGQSESDYLMFKLQYKVLLLNEKAY